jgi:hypothetical protein
VVRIGATLSTSDASSTPEVDDWTISYLVGPTPLSGVDFNVRGAKTIGIDSGGSLIYKYDVDHTSDTAGVRDVGTIEWDLYTMSVDAATTYDIASSCPPQPVGILPASAAVVRLFLAPHTANSLRVDVHASDGAPIEGADIRLYRGVYDATRTSDVCGQQLFEELSSGTVGGGNPYSIEVAASGYTTYSSNEVNVSGTTRLSVILN